MTTSYFLTGSFIDQDSDFEIAITIPDKAAPESSQLYSMALTDTSSSAGTLWQASRPDLQKCLKALGVFLTENYITLYSKILSSAERSAEVDKELEGFILNRLEQPLN